MSQSAEAVDAIVRRVIRASEEPLRRWMGLPQLESDLLAALYLRVRDVLECTQSIADDDVAEDVTLAIYLTASAWQSREEPPLDLLASLHQIITKLATEGSFNQAPSSAARRNL